VLILICRTRTFQIPDGDLYVPKPSSMLAPIEDVPTPRRSVKFRCTSKGATAAYSASRNGRFRNKRR
jgi:hypothetical protein